MLTFVAVSGVACMMLGDNQLNMTGVLFGLASGICYAAYGVIGKDILITIARLFYCSVQ